MPDRLNDALANSVPSRHRMVCPRCGATIKGSTALGVRFSMRGHRKRRCPKRAK